MLVAQAPLATSHQRSRTSAAAARSAAQLRDSAHEVSVFVLSYCKASNSKACNLSTSKKQVLSASDPGGCQYCCDPEKLNKENRLLAPR